MKSILAQLFFATWLVVSQVAQGAEPPKKPADEPAGTGAAAPAAEEKKPDPFSVPEKPKEASPSPENQPAQVVRPSGYPISLIDRPLALPGYMLEPRVAFDLYSALIGKKRFNTTALDFGAGFGLMENTEVGFLFPLQLSPKFDVQDIPLYGLYEFSPLAEGAFRWAGRAQMSIPVQSETFQLLADLPVRYKIDSMFAIIGSIGMGAQFGEPDAFLFAVDLGLLVQPLENLALSVTSGAHVASASQGSHTEVPLIIRGLFTLLGDLDVAADIRFLDLGNGVDLLQFLLGIAYRVNL